MSDAAREVIATLDQAEKAVCEELDTVVQDYSKVVGKAAYWNTQKRSGCKNG